MNTDTSKNLLSCVVVERQEIMNERLYDFFQIYIYVGVDVEIIFTVIKSYLKSWSHFYQIIIGSDNS